MKKLRKRLSCLSLLSLSLLYLSLLSLSLLSLSLYVQAREQKPVLLAVVGDSISYGTTLSELSQRYGDVTVSRLNQNVVYRNYSVPGATCVDLTRWVATGKLNLPNFLSLPHSAAVVVIQCGGNDIFHGSSAAVAYANVLRLVGDTKLSCKTPVTVLVATQTDVAPSFISEATRSTFNASIAGGATAGGYTVLNWGADSLLGCGGCSSSSIYFAADNVHPTQRGHEIMAGQYLAGALNALNIH